MIGAWARRFLFGGGIVFDLARGVIFVAIILALINTFWLTIFIVDGLSMEPSLHNKEIVILHKNAYSSNNPERGDVVVVQYPGDPEHKRYVKRVVGLPSESIKIAGGKVYTNDRMFRESYLLAGTETESGGDWQLSSEEYFLMGDNRPNSNDSRYFGGVAKRFILGRAVNIIYPRLESLKEY